MFSSDASSTSLFDDGSMGSSGSSSFDSFCINPASGLPMMDGMCGVDVGGNPFGTDFSHDHMASSSFDNDWMSSSSSSFDDSCSSSIDSSFSDW